MMFRNRFEAGRAAVSILAVILIVLIPVRSAAQRSAAGRERQIRQCIDEFTSYIGTDRKISMTAYDKLIRDLNNTGIVCDVSIELERGLRTLGTGTAGYELSGTEAAGSGCGDMLLDTGTVVSGHGDRVLGTEAVVSGHGDRDLGKEAVVSGYGDRFPGTEAVMVLAHVHSSACYSGHNHRAGGCRYHVHSQDCICHGTLSAVLRTESTEAVCEECSGRGWVDSYEACLTCRGERYYYERSVCGSCGGVGCSSCNYDGYHYTQILCRSCGGSGVCGSSDTCSVCGGTGVTGSTITHYKCSICGEGDTTEYGIACTKRTCGYDFEGYECGISLEDTEPRCGRIIVDAEYAADCEIDQFDPRERVSTLLHLTYLDGSSETVRAQLVDGSNIFDSSVPGTINMNLSYTGYYGHADCYTTRLFPVRIRVRQKTITCPRCFGMYYLNEDGSDPGCPYCGISALRGIYVTVEGSVRQYDEPSLTVMAVTDTGSILLQHGEYEAFYDTGIVGVQRGAVFYRGFREYFEINVLSRVPTPTPYPGSSSAGGHPEGEGYESGGELMPLPPEIAEAENVIPFPSVISDRAEGLPEDHEITGTEISDCFTNAEILEILNQKGTYELQEGDMVNVFVKVRSEGSFKEILRRLFLPGSLKECYSSGIII